MGNTRGFRRTAPHWVRALSGQGLHGLAGKLLRDFRGDGLSRAQDWLLDQCLNELEWRRRDAVTFLSCTCEMCCAPWGGLADDEPSDGDESSPGPF